MRLAHSIALLALLQAARADPPANQQYYNPPTQTTKDSVGGSIGVTTEKKAFNIALGTAGCGRNSPTTTTIHCCAQVVCKKAYETFINCVTFDVESDAWAPATTCFQQVRYTRSKRPPQATPRPDRHAHPSRCSPPLPPAPAPTTCCGILSAISPIPSTWPRMRWVIHYTT